LVDGPDRYGAATALGSGFTSRNRSLALTQYVEAWERSPLINIAEISMIGGDALAP
jgi:hypothetical protein